MHRTAPQAFKIFFILSQGFTKLLSCPKWAGTWDPPAVASQKAEITDMQHHARLVMVLFLFLLVCLDYSFY